MPGPLSKEHVAVYWGSEMDKFGERVHERINKRGYFVANYGKQNFSLPSRVIKKCHPAMVEHSAFLSQQGYLQHLDSRLEWWNLIMT